MNAGIVVILYHPDIAHINHFVGMFDTSLWPILLVDNSPTSCEAQIKGNITYIHCPKNVGIAEAQNIGLRALFSTSCNYAFLLDQDSLFTPDVALMLFEQFKDVENKAAIAALGPSIFCQFSECVDQGVLQKGKAYSACLKEVKQIIASGMLLSKHAFECVGEKETGLFIDGVDHEWCWRARSKGFKVFQSQTACMPHRQGDARVKVMGVTFKQGSPIRLYYQFRNVLTLANRSYVPLYWKCRHLLAIPLRYLVNRYCFEQGDLRGTYMRKGLLDGVKKRSGPIG